MSKTKLLQVTHAVVKEVKGSNGSNFSRGLKGGGGPYRSGSQGGSRNGSDWVMVKGGDKGVHGGVRSGVNGPKNDRQAHGDKKRFGPRDG
ncbi:hypothetical protein A2U01_0075705, partial [Trifolium medium]|nr:hypothetical protein [Trifolium medium]